MEKQKITNIIEEIPQYKVNKIANEVARRIVNVFQKTEEEYIQILEKLEKVKIKIARFEDEKITHYYEEGQIYFSSKIYLNSLNPKLIIEFLHYLSDEDDITYFNEAVNLYITKLLMQDLKERMEVHEIFISSLAEGNYALLVNLVMQLNYLIGNDECANSTIFGNEDYKNKLEEAFGGFAENFIKKFNILYQYQLDYYTDEDLYEIHQKIKALYFEIQNDIMDYGFNYILRNVSNLEEIQKSKEKLEELQNLRGVIEEDKDYTERKDKILERLNRKEIELSKTTKKNAIAIRYSNKILEFFKKIFSFNH